MASRRDSSFSFFLFFLSHFLFGSFLKLFEKERRRVLEEYFLFLIKNNHRKYIRQTLFQTSYIYICIYLCVYFHWRRNISFILKKIFNFQFTFTFPPTFNFPHNFFPCLFPTEAARYFLIAPFLFVEEEKPAAMHGGDRRNATSRASINVMLIFLTFLGIRASNRLCPRQARAT